MGSWMNDSFKNISDTVNKFSEDYSSVTIDQAKQVSSDIIDIHFKNK
jgi:hypothetical protein